MKNIKITMIVLLLMVSIVLSGCNKTQQIITNEVPQIITSVDGFTITNVTTDTENVKIVIEQISNSDNDISITIKWLNNASKVLMYGNLYKIEIYNENTWKEVELRKNVAWTLEGLLVYPANTLDKNIDNTNEIKTFNISEMFELKALGKYRLTSTFNFIDETQKHTATIEFELK